MLNMKKIIILGVAAALSFGAAFFLSGKPAPAPHATSKPAPEPTADAGLETVTAPTLGAKEKELDDLIKAVKEKSEELARRQEKVAQRERRLAMVQGQVKDQAGELESLRLALVTPLARLKEAKDQLDRSRVVIQAEERENLKRSAKIYETMDPERSGLILAEMCTTNQDDDVARILYLMSDRMAGKVLAALPDKTLAAKLMTKIKKIREQG